MRSEKRSKYGQSQRSCYIQKSDFNTFKSIIESDGIVKGIICPNADNYSRKIIDELTEFLKTYYGAKGLAWFKINDNKFDGGIGKFFDEKVQKSIISKYKISDNAYFGSSMDFASEYGYKNNNGAKVKFNKALKLSKKGAE